MSAPPLQEPARHGAGAESRALGATAMTRAGLGRSTLPRRVGCLALGAMLGGCAATESPDYAGQRVFDSPEQAVLALSSAAASGTDDQIESLFGARAREVLASDDPVADRHNREVFAVAIAQRWELQRTRGSERELIVGDEDWPFPVPIVRDARGWWFDTAAGAEEILARRIGRNELAAIAALRSYVVAQHEYARTGHDGLPAGAFAQRINSDPGTRNGLYWLASGEDDRSPLASFAAEAISQGYQPGQARGAYFGYSYRPLTRQGPDAPGGARDYVAGGLMTGGFAMIAAPIAYADTGIMTFIVGPDGDVLEADLGPDTPALAAQIQEFNPDPRWSRVP